MNAVSLAGEPRSVVRSQGLLLAAALVSMAAALLSALIVARSAPVAEFGFFALLASLLTLARDATELGTGNVTARRIALNPAETQHALGELLGWRTGSCTLAALVFCALAVAEPNQSHALVLLGAALAMLMFVNHTYFALFQATQRFAVPACVTIVAQVATVVAIGWIALAGAAPISFAVVLIVREAGIALAIRIIALRLLPATPRADWTILAPSRFLTGPGTVALAALTYQLSLAVGLLMIDWTRPAEELGAYGAAFRLVAPLLTLPWLLAAPLLAEFAKVAESGDAQLWERLRGPIFAALAIGGVAIGATIFVGQPILAIVYGETYAGGHLSAATSLVWLVAAASANLGNAILITALLAAGRDRMILVLGSATLLITIASTLVLLPLFGFAGAAAAVAGAFTFALGAAALQALRGRRARNG